MASIPERSLRFGGCTFDPNGECAQDAFGHALYAFDKEVSDDWKPESFRTIFDLAKAAELHDLRYLIYAPAASLIYPPNWAKLAQYNIVFRLRSFYEQHHRVQQSCTLHCLSFNQLYRVDRPEYHYTIEYREEDKVIYKDCFLEECYNTIITEHPKPRPAEDWADLVGAKIVLWKE